MRKLHYRTTKFHGLPISIENRKGSVRHWTDSKGRTGKTKMLMPYGYVRGVMGADGDHLDVYLGPNRLSRRVFVVNQRAAHLDARHFDEHKVLLGFDSAADARSAFLRHYDNPKFLGSVTEMTIERFKQWIGDGKAKKRPVYKGRVHDFDQLHTLVKGGGPFIGPRGGKWADPKHTIPWKESKPQAAHSEIKLTPHKRTFSRETAEHTLYVQDKGDGNVSVSEHEPGGYGATMPKASLKHFVNDLQGKVDVPKGSGNPFVEQVIDGKAEFLGKGDDGLAFRTGQDGETVVKVSTTVPYQPFNPGHRTPEAAAQMLRTQSVIGNKLADKIPGIQRSTFMKHGDKGFQIKPYVEIPERWTKDQLDQVQDTLIAMHKEGYALNDEVQPGIEAVSGKVVMFDVGKAAPIPAGEADAVGIFANQSVEDDMRRLKALYNEHGVKFARKDLDEGRQAWDKVQDRLQDWLKSPAMHKFARKMISSAADKRREVARAQFEGETLDKQLKSIADDEEIAGMEVDFAAEDAAKSLRTEPTDLAKAKYKRRWRGPDGKWRYEYDRPKKGRPAAEDDTGPIKPGMGLAAIEKAIKQQPIEHLALLDANGKQLLRLKGTKNEVAFSPADVAVMTAARDATLTHNHPSGGCLSIEDLHVAIRCDLAELRAVGRTGSTWVLRRPEGGWPEGVKQSLMLAQLRSARKTAAAAATSRMDTHLRESDPSVALGPHHPHFSQELFNAFVSEAVQEAFNQTGNKWGWQVERHSNEPADKRGDAPKRRGAGSKPRRGRAVPPEQLSLFRGYRVHDFAQMAELVKGSKPPGGGWQPIPGGRKGGYRRMRGGRWEHWYPSKPKAKRQLSLFDREEPQKPPKRVTLNVIQNDPILSKEQRQRPQSEALKAVLQKPASDPAQWGLPAGARVSKPWAPEPVPEGARWSHPDFGTGSGAAPWQQSDDWHPDFHSYDYVVVNSSAGKDSQAMLTQVVEQADKAGFPRERIIVVHADLGRVEWEGTKSLAREQAEHYGLRFEVVRREQNDLIEQIEERHGDLSQKDLDVGSLHEAGITSWRKLAAASQAEVLNVIGEGKGSSKWPGPHRAKELIRNATRKRNVAAKAHAKLTAKATESRQKGYDAYDRAKTDPQKQRAQQRIDKAQARIVELESMGDPWDWPVDFGKAIAFPSSDARFCTSDHKRVEVQKLITRLAKEHKERTGSKKPARVLNSLGIRAQESESRAKMDNFGREKTTRNQVIDRWYPIHRWHEKRVWDVIEKSGVPFHKAYGLGMRRLSCVFCVFAKKEDLMIAAVHNPKLFGTYLELEEKVGASFKADHSLADVSAEIERRRGEGYSLDELAKWVKKALDLDDGLDLVKAELGIEPTAVSLILRAALQRLRRHGQKIGGLTLDWKPRGLCVHLDTEVDSHHVEHLPYPAAYNASLVAAAFAQQHGLVVEEHNAPGPMPEPKLMIKSLSKAGKIGGKYIRRVPYTDKHGKRKFRYYYRESAIARDVQAGETVKLGKLFAEILDVGEDGSIQLRIGGQEKVVKPDEWTRLVSRAYGAKYHDWAEKRASQVINSVMRVVPRHYLEDLKGDSDAERFEDLQRRLPGVYRQLRKSFQRAGINPIRAKQILARTLERRGWEPEARALVVGQVLKYRKTPYRQLIRAAENLAGGDEVGAGHVATVLELRPPSREDAFKAEVGKLAKKAEAELAALSAVLAKARGAEGGAELLAQALNSDALHKLQLLKQAFPGLTEPVADEGRRALLEVPAHAPRPQTTTEGSETAVYVAGEGGAPKALKARYKLVEASEAIASHDPNSFRKRDGYPEDVQERAYHRDKAEQAKVIRNAQKLNPAFVVNTNPDAVNGPPMMTADGVVLGGNSRTMSMQRAYAMHPDKAEAYKGYLAEHAHEVGLTADDVHAMKNPILVREVEADDTSKRGLQTLVRQMNESFTQAMDPRTMQVAMGRKLSEEALGSLANAMEEDETLNAFLSSSRAEGFINQLFRAGIIDQRNANQYMRKGTKQLNNDGKQLVARILVGRTVADADILSDTGTQMVNAIAQAVPAMTQATAHGDGYSIGPDLAVAVDAFNDLQRRAEAGVIPALDPKMDEGRFKSLFNYFGSLFDDTHPVVDNPRARQLFEVLIRKRGPVQLTKVFRDYARRAAQHPEGQATMFGAGLSPDEVLSQTVKDALGKSLAIASGRAYRVHSMDWLRK